MVASDSKVRKMLSSALEMNMDLSLPTAVKDTNIVNMICYDDYSGLLIWIVWSNKI